MKEIIIATHGHLSEEFKRTVELIIGEVKNIRCFCMNKEKSEDDAKAELEKMVNESNEDNLIVLTDLFGGSSANICAELLMRGHSFSLLAGVNLPMLLTLLTTDDNKVSMDELLSEVVKAGSQGVLNVNQILSREDD
ncbi:MULTISPECIES: PTS sugar transporter subunit IIA [Lactobacillaceae]|uniref:PTS sugar transporter subunit IIA n=1 Tax=Lactobacillaceae TaxID=33958 RepID=UPI0021C35225|nr:MULTISPECIES: PTS mannose transporter subunit IIA [Lactobacillaceae]MCP9329769.1 PTS mannose transporter subunit IIA [Liquorilactobacillus satsumensis]MCP9334376.1 PTS mannose transporter subunit IIA [Lentilactobacillus hilgardii]MCP9350968.1 PTS mannose transporter subunit IIA [Lentilactobacillus hilgardii]MCP9353849.1 PTS mannose transporter subunit IIA [Lentilactobacillus hilgardii]